ncbi:MAG: DUF3048 domain-containing protein [Parcubacteria group bacterium]|nr:DUF3048 domain-containing protein [Parcubacteria group bacterium]
MRARAVSVAVSAVVLCGVGVYALVTYSKTVSYSGVAQTREVYEHAAPTPSREYSLTGEGCAFATRRPIAVMVASDQIARPLSGIADAEVVVELPVITGGITRLMALFQCANPREIGSVRSTRHDYLSLARAFDAVLFHWGGSHFALDALQSETLDHFDALTNRFSVYYRVSRRSAPHNGFTSYERAWNAVEKAHLRQDSQYKTPPRITEGERGNAGVTGDILIEYPGQFRVRYRYNPDTRLYTRYRGGTAEKDFTNGATVEITNIVVLRARSRQIEGQYNDVDIEGGGEAAVFLNGETRFARWEREQGDIPRIRILDADNVEIPLRPGRTWYHFVEPTQGVTWQPATPPPSQTP